MMTSNQSDWAGQFSSLCQGVLVEIPLDALDDRHPAAVFKKYWQTLATHGVPDRQAFHPDHIRSVLKWIMLLDAPGDNTESRDFKVRLHGTAAAAMMHGNLTGSELNQFCNGESYTSRRRGMQKVIATGAPLFGKTSVRSQEALAVDILVGMFPFSDRSHDRHQIIVVGAPERQEFRRLL